MQYNLLLFPLQPPTGVAADEPEASAFPRLKLYSSGYTTYKLVLKREIKHNVHYKSTLPTKL